jgi:ceramide glucosyltransferase
MNLAALLAMATFWRILLGVAVLGLASSTVFLGLVIAAAGRYIRRSRFEEASALAVPPGSLPPVTILKPIHGTEPALEENLESFFAQDYPQFEVIIGARNENDPGLKVAQKVRQRHSEVKSRIVLSGPPTWPNAKVFSLEKMLAVSSYSYLLLSDSDTHVGPGLLRNVIPSLLDPKNGLVTCPYRGVSAGDFNSTLEAMGMSVEMTSGVIVADMLEGMRFALGPVIATRSDALQAIGGLSKVADYYSDDFELGREIWAAGYKVVLSHYVIEHVLSPRSFWRTLGDQLRWMKSTRYSRPAGHVGSGLTFAVPFGVLGFIAAAALGHFQLGVGLLAFAWLNRMLQAVLVGGVVTGDWRARVLCWLYPLRDLLGFFIWAASFTSRSFFWRGEMYVFNKGGRITPRDRPAESAVTR